MEPMTAAPHTLTITRPDDWHLHVRLLRNLCALCVRPRIAPAQTKPSRKNTDNQPPCAFPAIYAPQPA